MPKDLTKLSLKDFEVISDGAFDERMTWENGTLVMTVREATTESPLQYAEV